MIRKLTLVFIIGISAAIFIFIYFNRFEKNVELNDFSTFPEGDFYGSIETSEIIRIMRAVQDDSLIASFPFSLNMVDGFLNTLNESGLDASTVYVVSNSSKSAIHLILKVNNIEKANKYLEEYAYLFDFQADTINSSTYYTYDKLTLHSDSDWLHIQYIDSMLFQELEVPLTTAVHPIDPLIFEKRNQFHYSSSITDSLGINKIVLSQVAQENGFQWLIELDAKGEFPFEFLNSSFQSHTFGKPSQRISVSIKETANGFSHPLRKKISKIFDEYGLNEKQIFNHWTGELTLEMGADIEQIDTIVTTTFDENFTPIEEYRVRRKMRPSYMLFLGSKEPEDLTKALNKNSFFRTRNGVTRLPNGRLTTTVYSENGVLYTTFNSPEHQPIQSLQNEINFDQNGLGIRLKLKSSSPTEISFLLRLLLPNQLEK
jgi:hypothetical protein